MNTSILPRTCAFAAVILLLAASCSGSGGPVVYKIALGSDFAPYDAGKLNGLNHDILEAVCAANPEMQCQIVDADYSDCFTSDSSGTLALGAAFAGNSYDGCMGWFITGARQGLGVKFSKDYAKGLPTHLIMLSGGTAPTGTDLGGAQVGFLAGFFNDATCLAKHNSSFGNLAFDGATQRDDALAALNNGTVTYLFWDSAPPLDPPAGTKYVGSPIGDCPDAGLALATLGLKSSGLVAAFDKGLATIRANGKLQQLCTAAVAKYGKGDPQCILQ